VQVAKRQHEVGAARLGDLMHIGVELGDLDFVE
jgi:hypothetical protein